MAEAADMKQFRGRRSRSGHSTIVGAELVTAVERSQLRHHPFDHIYMDHIFDAAGYEALLDAMPERRFYHQLSHRDALRTDGTSTRLRMYLYPELLLRLPGRQRQVWMPIARALCSKALQDAIKDKFRDSLETRFGKPVEKLSLYPVPILLRDQPGYRIGIHSDAENKAITMQFYLPRDETQAHIGTIFHEGNSGSLAERTTQMAFMPATGYAFPVALTKSWHSAGRTDERDGERVSMMVTYYLADSPWTRLRRRLRRGALMIGRHPKS